MAHRFFGGLDVFFFRSRVDFYLLGGLAFFWLSFVRGSTSFVCAFYGRRFGYPPSCFSTRAQFSPRGWANPVKSYTHALRTTIFERGTGFSRGIPYSLPHKRAGNLFLLLEHGVLANLKLARDRPWPPPGIPTRESPGGIPYTSSSQGKYHPTAPPITFSRPHHLDSPEVDLWTSHHLGRGQRDNKNKTTCQL